MGLQNPVHDFAQLNTLNFKLNSVPWGEFKLESFGTLARTLSIANAPTNQAISTGKQSHETPEFSILAGNQTDCVLMELWYQAVKAGVLGYKVTGTLSGYSEHQSTSGDDQTKLLVIMSEIFPIEFSTPAFSTDGDGEAGMMTGRFSVFGTHPLFLAG